MAFIIEKMGEIKQRKGRINHKILIEALGAGKTKTEAGKLAGSLAKDDSSIVHNVNLIIDKNSQYKKTIDQRFTERLDWLLEQFKQEDMRSMTPAQRVVAIGIIHDKRMNERGDPNVRISQGPTSVEMIDTPDIKLKEIESGNNDTSTDNSQG